MCETLLLKKVIKLKYVQNFYKVGYLFKDAKTHLTHLTM